MAKAPTLSDVTNILNAASIINANWDAIQAAFENTLSLDGSTPNSMNADLDLNSNDILNVGIVSASSITIGGVDLSTEVAAAEASATAAAASETAAASSASAASSSASSAAASASAAQAVEDQLPDWQGMWVTSTAYEVGDLVRDDGSTYICIEAHTSGTFATDLAALKWELFAQKGSAGAGSGDMLAANNLSDVADAASSRGNLGLGSIATQSSSNVSITGGSVTGVTDIAVADGGTGSSTAAGARTNLGAQAQDDILDDLSGLTQATNKIPYFDSATTAATLDFLDEDTMSSNSATAVPSQQSVKTYVDTEIAGVDAGDPNGTLLETITLSNNATAEFTSFLDGATYRYYHIVLHRVVPTTDGTQLNMRTSTNGGSTWATNYNYDLSSFGPSTGSDSNTTATAIRIAGGGTFDNVGSAAGEQGVDADLFVYYADVARETQITGKSMWVSNGGGVEMAEVWGERANSEDTDGIEFSFTSGNLESGTIKIYGVV